MALVEQRARLGREPIQIIELIADKCPHSFGVAPCTATGEPCYNTRQTCKDPANFAVETQSIFFAEPRSGLPVGVFPAVKSVSNSPTKIDPQKGLGLRASVSVRLLDFPHHDIGFDPYAEQRAYDTEQGTFWGKWLARNRKSYLNRPLRLHIGYIEEGQAFDWANFQTLEYVITKIDGPAKGEVTITGKDPLHKLNDVLLPEPSKTTLVEAVNGATTSLKCTSTPTFEDDGFVRIGSEIIEYAGHNAQLEDGVFYSYLPIVERGALGTEIEDHDAADTVQPCIDYRQQNAVDVVLDLLDKGGIPATQIKTSDFDFERDNWLSFAPVANVLSKPAKVTKLIAECCEHFYAYTWWDDRESAVRFRTTSPPIGNQAIAQFNEREHILADSVKVQDNLEAQINLTLVAYGRRNLSNDSADFSNYPRVEAVAEGNSDNAEFYGRTKPKTIFSNWLTDSGTAFTLASRTTNRYSDGERKIQFSVDAKDAGVWVGDIIELEISALLDEAGAPFVTPVQIMRAHENGTKVDYEAVTLSFALRYAFFDEIGGTDYDQATEEDKRQYGFYSNDNGTVEGDEGYRYA